MAVIIWELSKNHNSREQATNTLKESLAQSLIGLDCVTTEMFFINLFQDHEKNKLKNSGLPKTTVKQKQPFNTQILMAMQQGMDWGSLKLPCNKHSTITHDRKIIHIRNIYSEWIVLILQTGCVWIHSKQQNNYME
jgi:hypothetical protein